MQVRHEAAEEQGLLNVFLAEVRVRRLWARAFASIRGVCGRTGWADLYDVEQLRDHRRYTSKERGPALTLHLLTISFYLDERPGLISDVLADTRWIHL